MKISWYPVRPSFSKNRLKRLYSISKILFLFGLFSLALACGQGRRFQATSSATSPSTSNSQIVDRSGGFLTNVNILKDGGGRLDWSHQNDLIAFDTLDDEGWYQVHVMRPDGSDERCLTCNRPELPTKHKGNPSWHPDGEYIVFQTEKQEHPGLSSMSTPGMGKDNDLWLMTKDGDTYFQLTNLAERMGVLHPHFSHDGSKLLWSEKVAVRRANRGRPEGWAIKIADFSIVDGQPSLTNINTHQPLGLVFYETHGFSKDDSTIIFTGIIERFPEVNNWLDIYTMDLATGEITLLTDTLDDWDEHAHFSSNGDKIAWSSSRDCDCEPSKFRNLRLDIWIMNADGTDKTRLTHFSDPNYPLYLANYSIAIDNAWGPEGDRLAVYVTNSRFPLRGAKIVLLEFGEAQ